MNGKDKGTGESPNNDPTRTWLAVGVPALSMGLLIIISSIFLLESNDKAASAQSVFNTTLPLIGTWVGTVLAFYFTSHNFDAAAKNAREMVNQLTPKEKLQSIIVKDVWIPMENATTLTLDKDAENGVNLMTKMIAKLEKKDYQRLPILDMDGRVKYVVHRSLIDRFVVQCVRDKKDPQTLTLANMLEDEDLKKVLTGSFKTLRATSNLAEAKEFIDKIETCQDVFATEDGTAKTKALGWVTNVIVGEQATLRED